MLYELFGGITRPGSDRVRRDNDGKLKGDIQVHWTEYILIFLAIYAAGDIIASFVTAVVADRAVGEVVEEVD